MKYTFENRPLVKSDLIIAFEHYKAVNPKLVKEFSSKVRKAKAYIAKIPFGFQEKYKDVRTINLEKFPYTIHYRIDEQQKKIIILAIIYSKRDFHDYSNR